MRKVAITGMGIVSCLGNELDEVAAALRAGRSGIRHQPEAAVSACGRKDDTTRATKGRTHSARNTRTTA